MEIVQNIQRADEAVTRTGPYQSQGVAPILSGINEGLLGLGKAIESGSGKSSGDAKGGAYDYFAQRTAQANSKNFSGPSELKAFADETYSTAMNMFGVSETEAKNLAEMTGFKNYGDIPVNMLKSETAIKTKLYNNALRAGAAIVGADASMDQKYAVGIQTINATENILNSLPNIAQLTPEQQKQYQDNGGFRTFEGYIRDAWKARVNSSENADVPMEAAMLSFKNATIADLQSKGVDPLIAKSIVDSAMIYDEYSLYGNKVLEDNGLQYYRDAAKKAYDTDQAIINADIQQQFLTSTYDITQDGKPLKITGAQVMFLAGNQGSTGSTGAMSMMLQGVNALDLLPQFVNSTSSRYGYKGLRLSLSNDGAALATVAKDNPTSGKNIGDMSLQAMGEAVASANDGPANKPFIATQKINDGYTLRDGETVEPEVVDNLYQTPEDKRKAVKLMFDSIVAGTNKATRENGSGYGLPLVVDGKLQYFSLVGQRLENLMSLHLTSPTYRFENHTNRGTLIEAGDIDAVKMRQNFPEIQRTFGILEKSFGADRKEMYDAFNNYMIRNTDAGKIYFNQTFKDSSMWSDLFGDRNVLVEMSDADVNKIKQELVGLGEDSGPGIMKEALKGTLEDLQATGENLNPLILITKGVKELMRKEEPAQATQTAPQDTQETPQAVEEDSPVVDVGGSTRGARNNNPGNLTKSGDKWKGLSGYDGRFLKFETLQDGIRALSMDVRNKVNRGLNTYEKLLHAYAPSSENDTESYIQDVAQKTSHPRDKKVSLDQVSGKGDNSFFVKLLRAIISHESGNEYERQIPDEVILRAIQDGLVSV